MRARNIKPGFFKNDKLAECDMAARLLFVGLWCFADREGRLECRPLRLKAEILVYDEGLDINRLLAQLAERKFIFFYEVDGTKYIQINNWHKHQNPHHMEAPSDIPAPEGEGNKYNHKPITKKQRERVFARDKGRCVNCGQNENLHIDHIVPVSKGGSSEDDNLQTLCQQCNLKKSNKTERLVDDSLTNCSRPTDSLIPDSLNSDSRIPEVSAEPPAPAPFVSITLNDKTEFPIFESQIAEWETLFPRVDVRQELREMRAWALANPAKRKTSRGVLKFVTSWLAKEQDRGGTNGQVNHAPKLNAFDRAKDKLADWERQQGGNVLDGQVVGSND